MAKTNTGRAPAVPVQIEAYWLAAWTAMEAEVELGEMSAGCRDRLVAAFGRCEAGCEYLAAEVERFLHTMSRRLAAA